MAGFNFKQRFVPAIIARTKKKTIRGFRKTKPEVGERVYLFTGMRTKYCRRLNAPEGDELKEWCVVAIDLRGIIEIPSTKVSDEDYQYLANASMQQRMHWVMGRGGCYLHSAQADEFAWQDGFRIEKAENSRAGCFEIMKRWWLFTHGTLPFVGIQYKW